MDNEYEYENEETKKFKITRGMVILAFIALVILIVVIVIILNAINRKKPEYTTADFKRLESRMLEEAPTYLSQKKIELNSDEIRIDLKDLLVENGGSIDSSKIKVAKICDGYVLASKIETEKYFAYIKCKNLYTTSGYVSSLKTQPITTTKKDIEKPVITVLGEKEVTVNQGTNYVDQGATATDNIDGDITSKIKIENHVDISESGSYEVVYRVTDKAGNSAQETRKVVVVATPTTTKAPTTTRKSTSIRTTKAAIITTQRITTPPTITLKGNSYITMESGNAWKDPGFSALDAKGNDITSMVNVSGNVNTSNAGTYMIVYSVTDAYGNSSSKTRTVVVKSSYIKLQSISLTPNSSTISVGEEKTLIVKFNPSNATNQNLTWTSSNDTVATVSNGVIKGIKKGTATITATGSDGVSKSVSIIVK